MMDGNQSAVDLLRIIATNAEAESSDGMVQIDSLVQFLWATAKEINPTVPAFGQREWDTKTLLTISQLKAQFYTNKMELLNNQTQEEDEQAEDGKLEAVGNRDEAAEEELADKAKDPSVYSSEDDKKSPRGGVRTEDGDHSNSKSKRNKTTSGGVTFGGLTGRGKKAGGGLTSGGKRAGGTKDRGDPQSRLTGGKHGDSDDPEEDSDNLDLSEWEKKCNKEKEQEKEEVEETAC